MGVSQLGDGLDGYPVARQQANIWNNMSYRCCRFMAPTLAASVPSVADGRSPAVGDFEFKKGGEHDLLSGV